MDTAEIVLKLNGLKTRLEDLNRAWTANDYDALLRFFVGIVPTVVGAERCSIFLMDPGGETLWLKYGTGLKEREIEAPKDGSFVGRAVTSGRTVIENDLSALDGFHADLEERTEFVTRNMVCVPILSVTGGGAMGAIQALNRTDGGRFDEGEARLLEEIAGFLAMALENILLSEEIVDLSEKLNRRLSGSRPDGVIAESPAMKKILDTVHVVAPSPVGVFVGGESGTGKELVARMIHDKSGRSEGPFVPVNCAAIPENLVESEFFGHEKGAFTGAGASKAGLFETADRGTLFLDEIGDMPLSMQAKFLRALQEGEALRVGGRIPVRFDIRVITATNRDLKKDVETGRFREDLYYRLFSIEIRIPPLRERPEDVAPLLLHFLEQISRRFSKTVSGFSPAAMDLLTSYPWPGNVRQVVREVERLVALCPAGRSITPDLCSPEIKSFRERSAVDTFSRTTGLTMPAKVRALEEHCIKDALRETGGNKRRASALLGITRQGLDKKLKRYNIPAGRGTRRR